MNIYDIAKKAKVSTATISRATNPADRGKVSPPTLKRIDELIKQYGYTPNLAARHLSSANFMTIGVVLPQFSGIFFSDFYMQALSGIADALLNTEYRFKLIMLKPGAYQDQNNFKSGEAIDALVIITWPLFFSKPAVLDRLALPVLSLNDKVPASKVSFYVGDNVAGGELAARHLQELRHCEILVVKGPDWSRDSHDRVKGFSRYFEKHASARLHFLTADFQEDIAARQVLAFFQDGGKATAIFCCNDNMAFGALNALRRLRLRCPQDVSVMGYDDGLRAEYFSPSLSTIHVPMVQIAKEGTARLVQSLGAWPKPFGVENHSYPPRLVHRQSTAEVRR